MESEQQVIKRPISALSELLKKQAEEAAGTPVNLDVNKMNEFSEIKEVRNSLSTDPIRASETAPSFSSLSYNRFSGVANTFFGVPSFLERIIGETPPINVVQEEKKRSSFSESEDNGSEDNSRDSCSSVLTNGS